MSASVSWENTNVLSYVFQEKEHKANQYNRRNDNIYNFYAGKLTDPKKVQLAKEAEVLKAEVEKRNAAYDALEQQRRYERHQKERAVKEFQDKQKEMVGMKAKEEHNVKQLDHMMALKQYEQFTYEESKKRKDMRTKYSDHVKHVKNQMKEEPRNFAKTGIAIIQTSQTYL